MRPLTFVTGIYGAGKSTLCKKLSSDIGIEYFKASTLIFNELKQLPSIDKKISDEAHLDANQQALIAALARIDTKGNILLEGHTCLLDQNNEVKKIPLAVFEAIHLEKIVVVTRNITDVQSDLLERDGVKYNTEALKKLQADELEYTRQISQQLNILFLHIDLDCCDIGTALKTMKKFLE